MKTIKFSRDKKQVYLNGVEYKGYNVGDLPNSFGFKEKSQGIDENSVEQYTFGKDEWFNFRGLTYIIAPLKW